MGKRFDYEYIVIGAGAAGITAARQLVNAGHKVALVEQNKWGGRTIPKIAPTEKELEALGISCIHGKAEFVSNYDVKITGPNGKPIRRKAANTGNSLNSRADTKGATSLKVKIGGADSKNKSDQDGVVSAGRFLITAGTKAATSGISGLDKVDYYAPASVASATRPLKTVLVIGGGASGCEVAEYLAKRGSRVVIVESSSRLLPREDEEIGRALKQYFEKNLRIKTFTNTRAVALEKDKMSPRVVFMRNGQEQTVRVENIVLAAGREPALDLGLKNVGVSYDKNGLVVDRTLQTSARNVFAAGDILGGESSTERAIYTAEVAVMNMLGRGKTFVNFDGFMRTVDTKPQIASVGQTEDDLAKRSKKYKKAVVPIVATMAAVTSGHTDGFIKIMADNQGKILGASMMGPHASDVLQEIALAIRHDLPLVQVASTPHPAEAWGNLVKIAARQLMNDKK